MPSPRTSSARIAVHLRPRAARDEIVGPQRGVLVVRVSAPPIDDRANGALCRLLAKAAGVAPSRVRIVKGERAREKIVEIDGVAAAELPESLRCAGEPAESA